MTVASILSLRQNQRAMIIIRIMHAAPLGSAGKTVILTACKLHTIIVSTLPVCGQTAA